MSRAATEDRQAASPPPSTPRQLLVLAGRLAVVAALVVAVWLYLTRISPVSSWHAEFDLKVYRGAVLWWSHGHPLYSFHRNATPYGFTYPPFAALVMVPWSWFTESAAMFVNEVLSGLLVVAVTWWLVAPIARRRGWSRWFSVAAAVPLVYVMEPVRETLGYGQVNLILVALIAADIVALGRGRRWAGAGTGLATATKLTPGLFVLYLWVTGRRRPALVAVGTAAAATLLALAVAPRTSIQFWTSTLFDTNRVGKLYYASNQSLMGMLARQAEPGQPNKVLWAVLVLVVLVGGMWRARRAFRAGDELAGVTLTGLVTCLISPISWTHHLFWVVPAAVILLDVAGGAPLPPGAERRQRRARGLAAAGAFVVIAVFVSSILWMATDIAGHGHRTGGLGFVMSNSYLIVMLALVAGLPARALRGTVAGAPDERLSDAVAPSAARTTAPPPPGGSSPR